LIPLIFYPLLFALAKAKVHYKPIVISFYKACFTMMNKELNVQECDATMLNSYFAAGLINPLSLKEEAV